MPVLSPGPSFRAPRLVENARSDLPSRARHRTSGPQCGPPRCLPPNANMNTPFRDPDREAGSGRKSLPLAGITSARGKVLEVEDHIFTERNLEVYGFGVAWAWALFLGWLLFSGWIIGPDGSLHSIDFCWIWVSGKLAASSNPALIYNPAIFTAALRSFLGTDQCHFLHFPYPPILLFFTYPLGLLPDMTAFAVWMVAQSSFTWQPFVRSSCVRQPSSRRSHQSPYL